MEWSWKWMIRREWESKDIKATVWIWKELVKHGRESQRLEGRRIAERVGEIESQWKLRIREKER